MSTRDPNDLPPEGGEPTRYFPDTNPYEVPPTTQLPPSGPSDPTRVNPAVGGVPPAPPPGYAPTQATPIPPTTQLPPTGPVGAGPPPPPPAGGPPWAQAPLPWILGGVGALLLLALLIFFATRPGPGAGGTPTPTVVPTASATATVLLPTATLPAVVPPTEAPSATMPAASATPAPPSETPLPVPATVTSAPLPPTAVPPSATSAPPPPTPVPASPTAVPPVPTRTAPPVTVVPATVVPAPSTGPATPTIPGEVTPPAATPVPATPPPAVPGSLTVQWFGQSGVLLITPDGNTILVDPPGPPSGYQMPFLGRVDALLVSRDESDYNYVAAAQTDNPLVAARNGRFVPVDAQLSDARIQAVQSVGDQGAANGVWVIDSPNLYMVHLGGLKGPLPQSPQLRPQPDVLFLPVGGGSVLDAAAARQIVTQLKPRVVVPLHFKTDATRTPLAPVDDFLTGYRDIQRPGHTWTVKLSDLKSMGGEQVQSRVVVLDYK